MVVKIMTYGFLLLNKDWKFFKLTKSYLVIDSMMKLQEQQ